MKRFAIMVVATIGALAWAGAAGARNNADPILHNYQATISVTCNQAGDCALLANPVTNVTLLQHVSCQFVLPKAGAVASAYLTYQSSFRSRESLQTFSYSTKPSTVSHGINVDTYLLYNIGEQPRVDITSYNAAFGMVSCTLSGYYE